MLAIVSSLTDLRDRTIPNWLTIPVTVFALGARWYVGGWEMLKVGLFGFLVGFGVYFLFFLVGGRGGGDVNGGPFELGCEEIEIDWVFLIV